MRTFAENLTKVNQWLRDGARENQALTEENAPCRDLYALMSLFNNLNSEEYCDSDGTKLVAEIFLNQPNAYFQTLLVDTFEAFVQTRVSSNLDDSFLLKMVFSFTHTFFIFTHSDYIKSSTFCED